MPTTPVTVCDIIVEVPWNCGERDCPVGWHKANYWIDTSEETGYTVDNYADGDHEPCEEADVPSDEEVTRRWNEYYEDCRDTGKDVLGQLNVTHEGMVVQSWQMRFRKSILGCVLCAGRRNARGPWLHPSEVPKDVRDYFLLDDRSEKGRLFDFKEGFDKLKEYAEADEKVRLQRPRYRKYNMDLLMIARIDVKVPRKDVIGQIKRAARKALKGGD